jgi:hypothetical protein
LRCQESTEPAALQGRLRRLACQDLHLQRCRAVPAQSRQSLPSKEPLRAFRKLDPAQP